jgi:hypothetical protein
MSNTELTGGISPEYRFTVPMGEKIHTLLTEANGHKRYRIAERIANAISSQRIISTAAIHGFHLI